MSALKKNKTTGRTILPVVPETRFTLETRVPEEHLDRFSPELRFALQTVLLVGQVLQTIDISQGVQAKREGVLNLVTVWDNASKEVILRELKKNYPQDPLLSEEVEPKPQSILSLPRVWVADELDGTFNASAHINYYAVAIGLAEFGLPKTGAIYFPAVDQLYYGEVGVGAFWDGVPAKANNASELSKASITTNASYTVEVAHKHLELLKAAGSPRITVCGATVLSLAEVVLGRHGLGFALDTKPWDKVAPQALLAAAGLEVRGIDGRENPSTLTKDILFGVKSLVEEFIPRARPLLQKWNFKVEQSL